MQQAKLITPENIIHAELPDGRIIEGEKNKPVEYFLEPVRPELKADLMGGIVNGELHELRHLLQHDCQIAPLTIAENDGWTIYKRSMVFLMAGCFEELFPEFSLNVEHALHAGGILCSVTGSRDFDKKDLDRLEALMKKKIAANKPIIKARIPLEDAHEIFAAKKQQDKLDLLQYRKKNYLTTYILDDYQDYFYGYMLPSTGYLKYFRLEEAIHKNQFLLRFPKNGKSTEIVDFEQGPKTMDMFLEYHEWLRKLNISTIASINRSIDEERIEQVVLVSESLQDRRFMQVAERVAEHKDQIKVVLLAGPSSSGKTTSSKRLSIELLTHGISPIPIEMDNFFLDRELSPRDENGDYDFESIYALNIDLMTDCVSRLIAGEEVRLPRYDFKSGKSVPGEIMQLKEGQILILEGIHGLDPLLLQGIPAEQKFRVFVCPLTQVNIDRYNRVSTADVRLLRRIVRDFRDRGYSAQDTIARWDSVREGEEKWIFPFMEQADEIINTSLVYEVAALKPLAEPALRMVPFGTAEFREAKRLLYFLDWVKPMDPSLVPANSILKEFLGDSNLKNFTVWNA